MGSFAQRSGTRVVLLNGRVAVYQTPTVKAAAARALTEVGSSNVLPIAVKWASVDFTQRSALWQEKVARV
jgi:ABC-type phosphate transport system substrate-binding protein